ncbi:DUF6056 family protein [Enterococcus avium]|uniref:DUF3329 domain-containing protein n=1 Tax=Enterococcus avium TaxID=33945 RepID=UPI00288E9925|nr:DUF6056 family protein [Enterococcus avium]MDT2470338.1 DUF6056 family protein [Enterococcus avium]
MTVPKRKTRIKLGIILTCIFIFMFILNSMSPLVYDDYSYFVKTGSIKTIFTDEFHQYMNWTGRSVVHLILRLFTKLPKPFFNVYNSLMFTILIYQSIYLASLYKENIKKNLLFKISIIFSLLWLFTPSYHEVFLWMAGSINYLTAIIIMLSFILIYHKAIIDNQIVKRLRKTNYWKIIRVFIFGIAAGWCNENTSAGTFLIVLGYVVIYVIFKKRKIEKWMISGLLGNIIGFLFMVLAPGNSVRSAYFARNDMSLVWKIIDAIPVISKGLQDNAFFPITISLALIIYSFWGAKVTAEKLVKVLFFVGGLATIGVLAVSPAAIGWSRSYFGGMVFIFISLLIGFCEVINDKKVNNRLISSIILGYLLLLFFCSFFSGVVDIYINYLAYDKQYQAIEEQKIAGKKDIVVPSLNNTLRTQYPLRSSDDITKDRNNQRNKNVAAYWHVRSIKIEE